MHRLEDEDPIDSLGWLISMIAALAFLFGAFVYMLCWAGWLT